MGYTYHVDQCTVCKHKERTRGRPFSNTVCFYCRAPMKTIKIKWGNEKYAGDKAGTTELFPLRSK